MNKYKIIYADPPWSFNNKNTGGNMTSGSANQYNVMNIEDICKLPISEIANENCVLFMWWVASQPTEALKVVESWGFTLKTMTGLSWIKKTKNDKDFFGMGFWTRQSTENCLIATKGKIKRISAGVRNVIYAKVEEHSKKPDIFRNTIVNLMGDLPRVELFARQKTEGWDVFGNQVDNSIALVA